MTTFQLHIEEPCDFDGVCAGCSMPRQYAMYYLACPRFYDRTLAQLNDDTLGSVPDGRPDPAGDVPAPRV